MTYVCNGEHLFIESCNIRDLSDNSTCMVAHTDKMRPNGFPTYTNETRGTLKKLLPTCQQPSAKAVARVQDAQKKWEDQYNAAVNTPAPARQGSSASQITPVNINPAMQSADERASTRCITAGRSPTLCGENSLGKWFEGAIGNGVAMANAIAPGSADKLSKATKPLPPGLEIAGNYVGSGNWRMQFDDRSAMMSCGGLDQEQRFYTIGIVNNQAAIKIDITPKPFVLYMRQDGTLADAGPVVVNGRVVSGSGSVTTSNGQWLSSQTTTTQKLTPMEAQQYSGQSNLHTDGQYYTLTNQNTSTTYQPGTTTYSGPSYAAKTETCSTAILKSAGKTQVDALKGLTESMLGGESAPPTPPGLRMHGAYAAPTGFSVEFFPESAILGCEQAARAYPYSVLANGRQAVVEVDAPGHPVVMALKPDNSLDPGSGQYEVQGRRIAGQNADGDFVFTPLNQTCALGVLKPGPIPTAPSPSLMASANTSGTGMPTNRTATGDAVLSMSAFPSQPGAANPLTGHPVFLLKDSFNDVLTKNGMRPPAGRTPMQGWDLACQRALPQCAQALAGLQPYMAAVVKIDPSGKATFLGVPAGSYYVFGTTHANHLALSWDVRMDLKSGTNSLVLDQKSAETLQ
ncbi:MAG: hypothetical protein ABSH46_21095 [Bryobacteraceae bacterium]